MKPQPERIAKGLYWDRAWSLVHGCTPVSEGCANCWSADQAYIRSYQKNEKIRAQYAGLTTPEGRRQAEGKWNGQIRLMEKNLDLPLRTRKPTVWAVWNDLHHEDVPFEFARKAYAIMHHAHKHIFLILTKRPERMKEFWDRRLGGIQENLRKAYLCEMNHVWFGVTVENQPAADVRIPILLQIPAAVYFVSHEPALGAIMYPPEFLALGKKAIVFTGGESGTGARPIHPDWARKDRDQCQEHGVNFFFKQRGEYSWDGFDPYYGYGSDSGKWDQYICFSGEHGFCKISDNDGVWINYTGNPDKTACTIRRVGKKASGRLLDGQEWSQWPEVNR